ncbi:RNA polymerase sigma factor [Angustibacter sp. McL0619]|uniref:RNA polymerase sigma factor n=1 Tax=Angustibacter sp. McL0619 TaxID=3415676 RepID=UPI003CF72883
MTDVGADLALEAVVRAESGRLVGLLHRSLGDLDVAEEAVADAVAEALGAWRRDGIPDRPAAWLHTAARRNALDRLRRDARLRARLPSLGDWAAGARAVQAEPVDGVVPGDDERLALLFGCCHPALAPASRLVLTLRAVLGLTTAEIARATFEPEATVAQRISRAKRKIGAAAIPLRVPAVAELPERLDVVLTVVATAYNEAYLATGGPDPTRRDLADDATWLAGVIATALPSEPEALGLFVLLQLHQARAAARFDADGRLVLLADQDRSLWRHDEVDVAVALLERAAAMRRPGRYQLQAAITACHCEAKTWDETDWLQILTLYDLLLRYDGSPVVRLNRAVATARVEGPDVALAEVDAVAQPLRRFHLLHATRAQLLRELGRPDEARAADRLALAATGNVAERALLTERLA